MFGRKKSTTPTASATQAGTDATVLDPDERSFAWEYGDLDDPAPGQWLTDPAITDRTGR